MHIISITLRHHSPSFIHEYKSDKHFYTHCTYHFSQLLTYNLINYNAPSTSHSTLQINPLTLLYILLTYHNTLNSPNQPLPQCEHTQNNFSVGLMGRLAAASVPPGGAWKTSYCPSLSAPVVILQTPKHNTRFSHWHNLIHTHHIDSCLVHT